jgi:hypothetical protein
VSKRKNTNVQAYRLLAALYLFQKSLDVEEIADGRAAIKEEESDFSRIRCPLCAWQPDASSLWCCADCPTPEHFFDGCYAIWNTFDTHGVCPGCGHEWRWTSCLRCRGWSLHEDWYVKEES